MPFCFVKSHSVLGWLVTQHSCSQSQCRLQMGLVQYQILWCKHSLKSTGFADCPGSPPGANNLRAVLWVYRRERGKGRVLERRKILWKEREDKGNSFWGKRGLLGSRDGHIHSLNVLFLLWTLSKQISLLALFHAVPLVHPFRVPLAQPLKFQEEGESITLHKALGHAVFISWRAIHFGLTSGWPCWFQTRQQSFANRFKGTRVRNRNSLLPWPKMFSTCTICVHGHKRGPREVISRNS